MTHRPEAEDRHVSDEVLRGYKLHVTPVTLLVNSEGSVEQVWGGRWDASALTSAGAAFGFGFSRPGAGAAGAP